MVDIAEILQRQKAVGSNEMLTDLEADLLIAQAEIKQLREQLAEMRKDCDITDAANTALYGALESAERREKAERESGCVYCNDMKYMPFGEHEVYIDGNGKLDVDDDEDFQLNFCPMCGKRLEEHHEAD